MAYQMVATAVTLNDLEGHSPVADVFTCNPSNICAAFYTISTDSVLAHGSSGLAELLVNSSVKKNGHTISTDVARRAVPLQ